MNKLTLVLLGLFAMMSGLVGITAYVSNNEAYVKAQTIIDVNFGTGFPGTSLTESFVIENLENDTVDYSLTLLAPTTAGIEDIRPHLSIWKDPAESDSDGPVSGEPSYTGYGSFTEDNDTSDKWLVTFDIPGDKVPEAGVDYGCQIAIQGTVRR